MFDVVCMVSILGNKCQSCGRCRAHIGMRIPFGRWSACVPLNVCATNGAACDHNALKFRKQKHDMYLLKRPSVTCAVIALDHLAPAITYLT